MIYLQLFLSFLQIGMFSFGGGYAAMPLIQGQVVTGHKWLTMAEFTDLITISQMTPGPIAVNSATFVGIKIAGVPGAFVATLGCILPSCIIVTLIAKLYLKYRNMAVLQGVLASLRPARSGADRFRRHRDFNQRFLGQRRTECPFCYQLDHGGNLCDLSGAFAESEDEPDSGHGAGWRHESAVSLGNWRVKCHL